MVKGRGVRSRLPCFALGVALSVSASAQNILIFGKTLRPAHAAIIPLAGKALVRALTRAGRHATFIQNPAVFDKSLPAYGAVILLDVSEGVLSPAQKQNLQAYFKKGGGLVAVHSSIAAGKDWPWFHELIGTSFLDHPPLQPRQVHEIEPSRTWTQTDEWYEFSGPPPAAARIVATAGGHPVSWSVQRGHSRFWYTALGHASGLYSDPRSAFLAHLLRGVEWVLQPADAQRLTK